VGGAREEAMIILTIRPVTRRQHLKSASINRLASTVYAFANGFTVSEFLHFKI
jgi:hypothetical protein